MGKFTSLLWREWRDVRGTALGCAGLVAAASFMVQHWIFKYAEAEWAAEIFVPIAVLLFAVIVASDLFASDVKTKRIVSLALLPVPLRSVWTGKVTFLAVSITAFYAFVALLHAAILAVLGKEGMATAFFVELGGSWILLLPIAGATGAVVFYSTLGMRSFVSALLGLATAGGIMAGVAYLEIDRALNLTGAIGRTAVPTALIGLAVVFLAAGAVAFVRGHGRGRSRLRVAVLGFGCLLGFFVPASAATAVQVWRYHRLEPGDPEVLIGSFSLSADGRYVAVQVRKDQGDGTHARGAVDRSARVWVVRVADGRVFDWSPSGQFLVGWTNDGSLWVSREGEGGEGSLGRWVEPENGATIRRGRSDEYADVLPPGPFNNAVRWARLRPHSSPFSKTAVTYEIGLMDSAQGYDVESRGWPTLLREEGKVAVCTDDGGFHEVDILTGKRRVLVESGVVRTSAAWSLSPSGRYVLVTLEEGYGIVDREPATIISRWSEGWRYWIWGPAGRDLHAIGATGPDGKPIDRILGCVDLQTGEETRFDEDLDVGNNPLSVQPLPDGGFVVRCKQRGVVVLGSDGKVMRTLYAEPERTR